MKKYELSATYENIVETLRCDSILRNEELRDFIHIIDRIDGNTNISLDAMWGNGKTFFVKQVAVLLDYFREKQFGQMVDYEMEEIIGHRPALGKIELVHTYIPIYYDAWMFDDHSDPILSLIYSIVSGGYIKDDPTIKSNLLQKVATITSAITSLRGVSLDIEKLFSARKTCLESISFAEEIKNTLSDIFDQLIVEKADKLVVIIDELDRCKPDYAVKLLEKIKHFITDDRVIFIFSTNKEQLIHTIKKFYGQDFNGALYLNRFFDFQFSLSNVDIDRYLHFIDRERNCMNWSQKILSEIGNYFNFSLRDYNIYYAKLKNIINVDVSCTQTGYLYNVFAPFIWAFSIVDVEKERKFINGAMENEIIQLISEIPTLYKYAMNFISEGNDADKKSKIQTLYKHVFIQQDKSFETDKLQILSGESKYFLKVVGRV
ncbi:KAP family P-loop NTPase fold protein [Enterocloster lavalensis]|mgnify:CR=1 FL=1|uniref:KAP family P-loop NTPase fold protein n=1 Tax=Enterocloster lavalensis TaxID=460384 RepID=UPI001D084104|nr:P-loop NTPase fold protein [Enterocloster lavalensis]MCB6343615.1 KAP family NTPase [Enterocloster lavalensis]